MNLNLDKNVLAIGYYMNFKVFFFSLLLFSSSKGMQNQLARVGVGSALSMASRLAIQRNILRSLAQEQPFQIEIDSQKPVLNGHDYQAWFQDTADFIGRCRCHRRGEESRIPVVQFVIATTCDQERTQHFTHIQALIAVEDQNGRVLDVTQQFAQFDVVLSITIPHELISKTLCPINTDILLFDHGQLYIPERALTQWRRPAIMGAPIPALQQEVLFSPYADSLYQDRYMPALYVEGQLPFPGEYQIEQSIWQPSILWIKQDNCLFAVRQRQLCCSRCNDYSDEIYTITVYEKTHHCIIIPEQFTCIGTQPLRDGTIYRLHQEGTVLTLVATDPLDPQQIIADEVCTIKTNIPLAIQPDLSCMQDNTLYTYLNDTNSLAIPWRFNSSLPAQDQVAAFIRAHGIHAPIVFESDCALHADLFAAIGRSLLYRWILTIQQQEDTSCIERLLTAFLRRQRFIEFDDSLELLQYAGGQSELADAISVQGQLHYLNGYGHVHIPYRSEFYNMLDKFEELLRVIKRKQINGTSTGIISHE